MQNNVNQEEMKPHNFISYPWNSVLQNNESEVVARNIMVILSRTGNQFRHLSWDEYKIERFKDGNFSEAEITYFEKVIGYCKGVDTAKLFSPQWAKAL